MTTPEHACVLLIEDDRQDADAILGDLRDAGYQVEWTSRGEDGKLAAIQLQPDVVILDLYLKDMPGIGGIEVCRFIRRRRPSVPLIVLSSLRDKACIRDTLDAGADLFLPKPYRKAELLAYLDEALHRAADTGPRPGVHPATTLVRLGRLEVDLRRPYCTLDGTQLDLTPIEQRVLAYMAAHAGKMLTFDKLLRGCWGVQCADGHHRATLRLVVAQLRRKIEPDPAHPQFIETDIGLGYRLKNPAWGHDTPKLASDAPGRLS